MSTRHVFLLVPLLAAGCAFEDGAPKPKPGTQIGALRPQPPVDYKLIDMRAAVEEALAFGGLVTTSAAWRGHTAAIDLGQQGCPQWWVGMPPDDFVMIDTDTETDGLSWTGECATTPIATSFSGWSWWTSEIVGQTATRQLVVDATVTDLDGAVLFEYDGEASDTLDLTNGVSYSSAFAGEITGPLAGIGSGLRASHNTADANGGFEAAWASDGSLTFRGAVEAFDGFGPVDTRDPEAPELEGVHTWTPGMPRFTSARFDLEFRADCALEPYGYIGLRGNEGFWFDVYFLPMYPPDADNDGDGEPDGESAQSNAYPYEQIDNESCDGIGTLFARNVDLKAEDEADAEWSREIAPDFATVAGTLPTPSLDEYVLTLRHQPEN